MIGGQGQRLTAGALARLLVVLALVPALVVGLPSVAQAATYEYGSADAWSYDASLPGIGGAACTGEARWRKNLDSGEVRLIGTTKCRITGTVSAFGGFDSGSFTVLSFTGSAEGLGGGVEGPQPVCVFEDKVWLPAGDPTTASFSILGRSGCNITSVCQSVYWAVDGFSDSTFNRKCLPIALGEAPVIDEPPVASCEMGTFDTPTLVMDFAAATNGGSSLGGSWDRYDFLLHLAVGQTATPVWKVYVLFSDGRAGGDRTWGTNGYNSVPPDRTTAQLTSTSGTATVSNTNNYPYWLGASTNPSYATPVPVGVGVYRVVSGATYQLPQNDGTGTGANGRLGVSNPANCSFYWGEKLANVANSDIDEPISALPDAPDPDTTPADPVDDSSNGCDFSFLSPSTWASGGICALVGLVRQMINVLGDILDAVGGLADDIASAITSGLGNLAQALFIPSDGFLDDTLSGMSDDWQDTSPGQYVSGLADAVPSVPSGAGCAGIPVDLDVGLAGHTQPVSFDLGAACGGPMASAAAICKTVLSAFLLIGAAWACGRYVLGAIYPPILGAGRGGDTG